MPAQFESGRKIDSKNSFLDFDAEEKYLHTKNRPVSIIKPLKNDLFTMLFQIYTG